MDFDETYSGQCHGRLKESLEMLIWEHGATLAEGGCLEDVFAAGRFFEVKYCEALEPSPEQFVKIGERMKAYADSEWLSELPPALLNPACGKQQFYNLEGAAANSGRRPPVHPTTAGYSSEKSTLSL